MWKNLIKLALVIVAFAGVLYIVKEIGFNIGMRL